jgi:hypothetical protein
VKLHLLTHLQTDIRRFGPLVGCSTEVFESFNAIFRQCSVLSNHQAPSRDIAIQFGKLEGYKHRVTGGWWKADNGEWVQVGPGIKRFVANNLEILENVGLSSETPDEPGMSCSHLHCIFYIELIAYLGVIRLTPRESKKGQRRQHLRVSWEATKVSQAINSASFLHMRNQSLFPAQYLVARSSDRCTVDSWVVAHSPQDVRV